MGTRGIWMPMRLYSIIRLQIWTFYHGWWNQPITTNKGINSTTLSYFIIAKAPKVHLYSCMITPADRSLGLEEEVLYWFLSLVSRHSSLFSRPARSTDKLTLTFNTGGVSIMMDGWVISMIARPKCLSIKLIKPVNRWLVMDQEQENDKPRMINDHCPW